MFVIDYLQSTNDEFYKVIKRVCVCSDNNNDMASGSFGPASSSCLESETELPPSSGASFTWEKLSPEEFHQLQEYAACK